MYWCLGWGWYLQPQQASWGVLMHSGGWEPLVWGNFFSTSRQRKGIQPGREGPVDYFCPFYKATEISPNLLSLFSLKAVAQGTLPILICLFFSLSFHNSYFLYWIIVCPCWKEENKTGEAKCVKAPGAPHPVLLSEAGAGGLPVCSERHRPPAGTPTRLDLIRITLRVWFAVYGGAWWKAPNFSKLS